MKKQTMTKWKKLETNEAWGPAAPGDGQMDPRSRRAIWQAAAARMAGLQVRSVLPPRGFH